MLTKPNVHGVLWTTSVKSSISLTAIKSINFGNFRINTPYVSDTLTDFDYVTSKDGTTLIFISASRDSIPQRSINILSIDKAAQTLPINEKDFVWDYIGPERESNHFGVLAHSSKNVLVLLDVTWSTTSLVINVSDTLPISITNFDGLFLSLSPDWSTVIYGEQNTATLRFYSTSTNQLTVQYFYKGQGYPYISWSANAFPVTILPYTIDDTVVRSINQQGFVGNIAHLEGTVQSASSLNSKGQLLLAVSSTLSSQSISGNSFKYVLFDVRTGEITDLCISGDSYKILKWGSDERFIGIVENYQDTQRILFLDTTTRNFFYLYLTNLDSFPFDWVER